MSPCLAQASALLHPGLAAAGLAAAGIPVLIHLVNRRRHRRLPWAAMTFLLAASRKSRSRIILEHWVLLALRVAVVALLGLAAARPSVSSVPLGASATRSHRILVIDDSCSTRARTSTGGSRFAELKGHAETLLTALPPHDCISLVTLGTGDECVRLKEAADHSMALDRLASIESAYLPGDWVAGLRAVDRLISESSIHPQNQFVYLFSDFARTDWEPDGRATSSADALTALAARARVTAFAPSPGEDANAAIVRLVLEQPLVGARLPSPITVEVANFGDRVLRDAVVEIRQNDVLSLELSLPPIEPGSRVVEQGLLVFPQPGVVAVTAGLRMTGENVLAADDRRILSVDVRRSASILLVDGRPGASRMDGQAGYIATALAPQSPREETGLFDAKVVTDFELSAEVLDDFGLVVLCNVQRLAPEQWTRLDSFVQAGGGLLVFAGDLLSADAYNRHAAPPNGSLLPGRFGNVVAAGSGPEPWTRLALTMPPHPMLADFQLHADSGLFLARVQKYMGFEPAPGVSQVVLAYETGAPALVVSHPGRGACGVFTTTGNMDWTNLPGKGDFVALLVKLASSMIQDRGIHRNGVVGDALEEPLRQGQGSLVLRAVAPDGSALAGSLLQSSSGGALSYRAGPVLEPGLARLQIGQESRPFAFNLPTRECDVRLLGPSRLREVLQDKVQVIERQEELASPARTALASELGSAALCAVMVLLLVETLLAAALGGGPAPARRSAP